MAINKVVYGNQVLIDITDSTVNPNTLLAGYKGYGADGNPVVGALQLSYHITLHQAQYDALSESEQMADENWFYIDDAESIGAQLDDSVISPAKVWSSKKVSDELQAIVDLIYPVGSIYMSVNNASPATLFGGTWERWGNGKVAVGVDENDTNFDTVEETGGDKTKSYTPSGSVSKPTFSGTAASLTHSGGAVSNTTLNINQIPSHSHGLGNYVVNANISQYANINVGSGSSVVATAPSNYTSGAAGGGQAHGHGFTQPTAHSYTPAGSVSQPSFTGSAASIDVIQPYITCYMWKRTA